jgi:DNA-binding HxlR family transcriptional regulator
MPAVKRNVHLTSDHALLRDVFSRGCDPCTLLVLCRLEKNGALRFNAIKHHIEHISTPRLARTLRCLERDGFLARSVYPTSPPHVEYALTALGESLLHATRKLLGWAERNQRHIRQARAHYSSKGVRQADERFKAI